MDYLISTRARKGKKFSSDPGPTRYLEIPDTAETSLPTHKIPRKLWVDRVLQSSKPGVDSAAERPEGDILIYIHGYNTTPEGVLARQRILSRDLTAAGFGGIVVGFDWPSAGSALNYLGDRRDARRTALSLVEGGIRWLAQEQAKGCRINLHVLAHSTGAFLLREAFEDADDGDDEIARTNWTVSQVAFISADISRRSLAVDDARSDSLLRHCIRLTNYSNPYDAVLKLSNVKRVGAAPRAGRVGLPENHSPKAINVCCGEYFGDLDERPDVLGTWCHSWHIGDPLFTQDLLQTLRGDIDRHFIPSRRPKEDGQLQLALPKQAEE